MIKSCPVHLYPLALILVFICIMPLGQVLTTFPFNVLELRDVVLTILAFSAVWVVHTSKRRVSLPPGPKGYPIVGNIFQMPKDHEWLQFNEWAKEHGMNWLSVQTYAR